MKNLTVLLAGFGLGLILIAGSFEGSRAEEKGLVLLKDTLLSSSLIKKQAEQERIKKNFIYQKPGPANSLKVSGEFLLGGAGAILAGVAGGLAGYGMAHDESEGDLMFDESGGYGIIIGYLITSNLGCALGVYLIGNIGDDKGSFVSALGGSAAGTLAGMGLSYLLLKSTEHNEMTVPVFAAFTAAQATGATLVFNLSRKKKVEVSSGALLNLNDGKLSLAFPQGDFSKDTFGSKNYNVNLFQVNL